jgi:hypothetical protein
MLIDVIEPHLIVSCNICSSRIPQMWRFSPCQHWVRRTTQSQMAINRYCRKLELIVHKLITSFVMRVTWCDPRSLFSNYVWELSEILPWE